MANSNRLAKSYLNELSRQPKELHEQGFTPLIRYLEANAPLCQRVGYSTSTKQEFAFFGQTPLMHFYPAAFTEVKTNETTGALKLKNSYFGMLGINGPLPIHLTEYAIERKTRHRDNVFSEFLDVFNHRFISLFYRAWADNQPAVSHDNSEKDTFKSLVGALAGVKSKPKNTQKTQTTPSQIEHYLAGLINQHSASTSILEQLLAELLGAKVNVNEFDGDWYPIAEHDRSKLGKKNNALGQTATLGEQTFQRAFKFNIVVGPVSYKKYIALVRDNKKLQKVEQLIRSKVGYEYDYSLDIVLDEKPYNACSLGDSHLAINSWIASYNDEQTNEAPQVSFRIESESLMAI